VTVVALTLPLSGGGLRIRLRLRGSAPNLMATEYPHQSRERDRWNAEPAAIIPGLSRSVTRH
jgi:hypothetical protein